MIDEGIGGLLTGIGSLGAGIGALGSIGTGLLNYGNSKANLDYQKALQQEIFKREDTSLQRRMADAKSAGLNPYSVLQTGGSSSGNVVKTEAPQLQGMNLNGILDTVNSILQIQERVAETNKAKQEAINSGKTGLILDADLANKDWQNKMYGQDYDLSKFAKYNSFLNTMRNMADFNFDFNTDFRFKLDGDDWNIDRIYGNSRVGDTFFGQNKDSAYGKSRVNEYAYNKYLSELAFYNAGEAEYYYNNYLSKDYENRFVMQDIQRALLGKQNDWYNWNQGFDMVKGAVDSVTGILFKNLDLGLKKQMNNSQINLNSSSAYRNYSQGYRNYYGR